MNTWIDLSFPIEEGMMTYPSSWHPKVKIVQLGRLEKEGRESRMIRLGTHTGTHIDAPTHFLKNTSSIDKISLENCVGLAKLISLDKDIREIGVKQLKEKIKNDSLQRLIIRFGWSKQFGKKNYYKEYPYLSKEACHWIAERGVKLLGYDAPSPDNPVHNPKSLMDSPNHKFLLSHRIYLLEYLTNLEKLKEGWIYLIALPLKIKKGDGSPARVIARNV